MQDIGGCRAIFPNEKKLRKVVKHLKRKKEFKNKNGTYNVKDYIKTPKEGGYRSYHLIGWFDEKRIEIQLRTYIQHYWATALEIIDIFTDQALKSNQGDEKWKEFFRKVGEQFSIIENIHLLDQKTPKTQQHNEYKKIIQKNNSIKKSVRSIKNIAKKLEVKKKLEAFSGSLEIIKPQEGSGYVLLEINTMEKRLQARFFSDDDPDTAEQEYISSEKRTSNKNNIIIVLISTTAIGGIKEAYPNFFADSTKFLIYLDFILQAL